MSVEDKDTCMILQHDIPTRQRMYQSSMYTELVIETKRALNKVL